MCIQLPSQTMKIPQRSPYESEVQFFNESKIPGYAAPDNKIVMNPNDLPGINKDAVKQNEAMRIYLRSKDINPPPLTKEQEDLLNQTPHYNKASERDRRSTVMGRLASGDPSAGKPSKEQLDFLKKHQGRYQIEE